jgi:outer membrane protein insertion porin family
MWNKMRQDNNFWSKTVFFALITSGIFFSSCRGIRHLPEGQVLYTGANVEIEAVERIRNKGSLASELEGLVRPNPNSTILGMRPSVWIYNITRDSANGWLKRWLHNQIGEAPVTMEQVNPSASANLIQNRLYNRGFFDASVDYQIQQTNRTAQVNYQVNVIGPYRIDTVIFPSPENALTSAINELRQESLLKQDNPYNVDILLDERQRLSRGVRDRGFYYFAPDHMIFRVDSTLGDRRVRIFLNVKEGIPPEAVTQFRMGRIAINPNYAFGLDTLQLSPDTVNVDNFDYLVTTEAIRPRVITNAMFLLPDSIYSRTAHEQTISRLMGLGIYQYANIRFERPGTANRLNAIVHLTPVRQHSVRTQFQWVISSIYTGPNLSAAYQNRNMFGGAELFELRVSSGLELGTGGGQTNFTSYNFGVESSIFYPRFVIPFINIRNVSSYFVPQTRIRLSAQRINRVQFFTVNSFNAAAGYFWNETRRVRHDLNVADINFFQLVSTTSTFHEIIEQFPFQQRSFEERFILGTNYSYTYNTQLQERRRHNIYFNGMIDISGNMMQLIQRSFSDHEPTPEEPYTIFNRPYSQFTRLSTDFRYFYSIDRNNTIATRLFVGVGVPYGNSESMPFVKQFYVGGTNSIRAFAARSIGPGLVAREATIRGFFDQLGDMRLEGNLEYRFPIYGFFKGAVFLDAGNIWMISEEAEEEARFSFNDFYNQLAVGTGLGLRIDVEFFLLRFDFGVPLREPVGWVWEPGVERNWRNITFNIGIGYSF